MGPGETRVALVPEVVKRLAGKGLDVRIAPGAGARALLPDAAFAEAGAELSDDVWGCDVVLKVAPPSDEEIGRLGSD
jgi:NAD(P) transhydrogenase subunit alpha